MNTTWLVKRAIVIGIAGAMVLSEAVPAFAAPVPSSTAIVKSSAPDMIEHVRSRRGQRIGAGVALGVIGALVGAAAVQNQYYYGSGLLRPGLLRRSRLLRARILWTGVLRRPRLLRRLPLRSRSGDRARRDRCRGRRDCRRSIRVPRLRRGACWIETDARGFGYWGQGRWASAHAVGQLPKASTEKSLGAAGAVSINARQVEASCGSWAADLTTLGALT